MEPAVRDAPPDAGPPWRICVLISELIEHWAAESAQRQRERDEFFWYGYYSGVEATREQAARDADEPWQQLSRRIRADAGRLAGSVSEPRERPQADDEIWFTPAEWKRLTERSGV